MDKPTMTNTCWPYEKELHKEIEALKAELAEAKRWHAEAKSWNKPLSDEVMKLKAERDRLFEAYQSEAAEVTRLRDVMLKIAKLGEVRHSGIESARLATEALAARGTKGEEA